jgi:branched-chain amino acid transport system ATP-binding protein
MSTAPALELDDLSVSYGSVPAVRKLGLTVGKGEIVGLIGPNGAGKSTTLHAITGLVRPRSGDIRLAGASIVGRKPETIARAGIALVPEGRRIFAELTVEDNLRLGLVGRTRRDGIEQDREWVEGLFPVVREFRTRQAGVLSGGQQQQLAIARALVASPSVLLLDEPSLGLAPIIIQTVFETIKEINAAGTTILLVEQNALQALNIADRGYVLQTGSVVLSGPAAELREDETVRQAYLGEI